MKRFTGGGFSGFSGSISRSVPGGPEQEMECKCTPKKQVKTDMTRMANFVDRYEKKRGFNPVDSWAYAMKI